MYIYSVNPPHASDLSAICGAFYSIVNNLKAIYIMIVAFEVVNHQEGGSKNDLQTWPNICNFVVYNALGNVFSIPNKIARMPTLGLFF